MKLYFHPGTNMAQAMAETVSYVNRARAFMPPGTVSPFVMRFDTGSVPVGYLVLSSETRSIGEIQDLALFRVRPMFASLPGVSAPPPFGGNQRTVVITVDPQRLRAYDMTPDDVVNALAQGNAISPSGNLPLDGKYPFVPVNSVVRDVRDLETIPLRSGPKAPVYIRDVGYVQDSSDAPTGYALADGRRAVYILVTKRADASTMSVVNAVKAALPDMQAVLPPDIHVSYEFDQLPYVTRAIWGVVSEGALGAVLVGLMILLVPAGLAERDRRPVEYPPGADGGRGRALAQRADHQRDDPGRTGPGHRHSGGRGDRGDREHPHPDGPRPLDCQGRAAGKCADRRSAALGDGLHPGRVHFVVLHAGRAAGDVRALVAGRRVLDGGLVSAVQHVRPRALRLAVASRASRTIAAADVPLRSAARSLARSTAGLRGSFDRFRQGYERAIGGDRPLPLGCRGRLSRRVVWRSSGGWARGWARRSSRPSTPANSAFASAPRMEPTSTTPSRLS